MMPALRVVLLADDREGTADSVERLMGSKGEARFAFIFDKAEFASEDLLDVWGRQTFCDGIWVYTGAKYLISRNFLTFTDLSAIAVSERVCFLGNSILGRSVYSSDTFWGIGACGPFLSRGRVRTLNC